MSRDLISRKKIPTVEFIPEVFTGIRIESHDAEWADTGLVWTEDILNATIETLEKIAESARLSKVATLDPLNR
jgi:hypothetical protein